MTFQVGQEVTPINDLPWFNYYGEPIDGPRFGATYVITGFDCGLRGDCFLSFAEYAPRSYQAMMFRPVVKPKSEGFLMLEALLETKKMEPVL